MSKFINVQIGRSTVEALELGTQLVVLKATIYGAKLISSNGWGKIVGYRDEACTVRTSFQLISGRHPKFGDIARAKLASKPFRTGATVELVLVMTEEKIGTRKSGDEEYAQFDWVARIVDFSVVGEGEGEAAAFKPYVKGEKKTEAKPETKGKGAPASTPGTYGADLS